MARDVRYQARRHAAATEPLDGDRLHGEVGDFADDGELGDGSSGSADAAPLGGTVLHDAVDDVRPLQGLEGPLGWAGVNRQEPNVWRRESAARSVSLKADGPRTSPRRGRNTAGFRYVLSASLDGTADRLLPPARTRCSGPGALPVSEPRHQRPPATAAFPTTVVDHASMFYTAAVSVRFSRRNASCTASSASLK